jgi:hypothetical protein
MPRNVWEIEINNETPREDIERYIIAARHTSDPNVVRVAGKTQAELARREREEWASRFDAQERARVQGQTFQAAQNQKLIEAQKELVTQQIEVARQQLAAAKEQSAAASKQAEASESAARGATQTATATKWLAILTGLLVLLAAVQIISPLLK